MGNSASVDTRFFDQYLATAIWADLRDEEGNTLDEFTIFDFDKASRDKAREECADFISAAGELLEGINMSQAGHDFWLTRNRHGAGFWDRGLGEQGRKLTELAHVYGESNVYAGDDDKIHIS